MGVLDKLSDAVSRFGPKKGAGGFSGGGIGNGHGMVPFDDNMIVSKPAIIAHSGQIFFNFLAMACYASVAAFQAKFHVGPSGLSGFAIFVSVAGILLSSFMLLIPVAYERYDKFVQLARTLKEVRVSFILTGTGATFSLLIAFISTISVWTQPGCKDPSKDPSAEEQGDPFKDGLPGWCNTKKAASIFFWIAFVFWGASVGLLIWDWRSGRLNPHTHRDPPFTRPQASEDDDEDGGFTHIQRHDVEDASPSHLAPASNPFNDPSSNSYSNNSSYSGYTGTASAIPPVTAASYAVPAGRPSMDAYGAFSDPAPTGFGTAYPGYSQSPPAPYATAGTPPAARPQSAALPPPSLSAGGAPLLPEPDLGPRVSRTMQYADPYAAVRASISGGATSPTGGAPPPSYEGGYGGYR